jgi:para-nitrobenzyl esterase
MTHVFKRVVPNLIGCVFIAMLMVSAAAGAPASQFAVTTESGAVVGEPIGEVLLYRAIPYAAPPTGPLRWRPPQPTVKWSGLRVSRRFAPACPQQGVSMAGEAPQPTSEDCLYLNIWTPAGNTENLPVLVWLHGGAFVNGSASMPLYWGDRLAARGIIVVTVAYRLGALGFLAHPELSAESPSASSGNYGLMDQIAALKWVQKNIRAFGGDERQVTIAGQSSGATSVAILMASPAAQGLFHRAIAQSGGLFEPLSLAPSYFLRNAEREGLAFASDLGASGLEAMRALPVSTLLRSRPASGWHPVIEPVTLPRAPHDVFRIGEQAPVPLLLGYNAEEARSLTNLEGVTADRFEEDIARAWGPLPERLLSGYPRQSDLEAAKSRSDFERDLRFGWNIWKWSNLHVESGRGPVYAYYFMRRPPFPAASVYARWGAAHFAELWYMTDHLEQEAWAWSPEDHTLADRMSGYWVNFVRSGNPNDPTLPVWPTYDKSRSLVLYLDAKIKASPAPNVEQLSIFDEVYEHLRSSS